MEMKRLFTRVSLVLAVGTTLSGSVLLFAADGPEGSSKPADRSTPSATKADTQETTASPDIAKLKKQVADQQEQIEQLLRSVQQLKVKIDEAGRAAAPQPAAESDANKVASLTPVLPKTSSGGGQPALSASLGAPVVPAVAPNPQEKPAEEASPLQLRVGAATITPVGFMDFTSVWRSRDGGSGIGTNFAGIPYSPTSYNTNLGEFRLSMQNSRVGFRVDADVKGAHVIGYMESDFLGNNPGNVAVSSNSNTMRSRLYWVDLRKNSWEVLGGQTWSLVTPGRTGISPLPGDLFYTQNIDVNYQLGLFWGRIPEFRVVYHHPSGKAHFAFAIDNPEQYVGGSAGGGAITFPTAPAGLAGALPSELNIGSNTLGVPNVAPDIVAKLALDPSKKFHFEIGGVERNFKTWAPANGTTPATTFSAAGGGGFLNVNFELFKGFRVLTNNFLSDGGGRYIFGQAPDLIVKADGSISLIHADSTVTGIEYTNKNTLVYTYYGGLYIGRNSAIDSAGKLVGYGYSGSSSGHNKSVQEATFGLAQTFWKNPKYGSLILMGQYSYVARNPWAVASGSPNDAHLNMVFLNLRYALPGSAPTMGPKK